MSRHELTRTNVDLTTLEKEMSTRLGRTVTVSVSPMPREGVPGMLTVRVNDEEIDVPDAVVQAVIAAHVPPVRVDPVDELITGLNSATNVASLRSVLLTYARAQKQQPFPSIKPG